MSIRGARFTRNSIDKKKPLVNTQYGVLDKTQAPRQFSTHHQPRTPSRQPLRNQKNFIRVRILYFRSRREALHIDIFARRIRRLYQVRFAGHGNSIWIIPLCHLGRRGCRRRWWRCCGFHRRGTCGLNGAIGIERLLRRRVLFSLGGTIARGPMSGEWWLRLFTA